MDGRIQEPVIKFIKDNYDIEYVDTITEPHRRYTITGAPRVAGNVVVIGNSGAEFDARGEIVACIGLLYDADRPPACHSRNGDGRTVGL